MDFLSNIYKWVSSVCDKQPVAKKTYFPDSNFIPNPVMSQNKLQPEAHSSDPKYSHKRVNNVPSKLSTVSTMQTQLSVDEKPNTSALSKSREESCFSQDASATSIPQPQPSVDKTPNTSVPVTCRQRSYSGFVPVRSCNDSLSQAHSAYLNNTCVPVIDCLNNNVPAPSVPKSHPSSVDRKPDGSASVSSVESLKLKSLNPGQDPSASQPTPHRSATLSPHPKNQQRRSKYLLVHENASATYKIPKHVKDLMKNGIVPPQVLNKPLSQSTYKDYFATLMYAEDFYIEKWTNFLLKNVTLELEDAEIYRKKQKHINRSESKILVKFEIDSTPEHRPFLLSRDFVFAQPVDDKVNPFKGIIYRVVKSNIVLAEFGEDFHSHHKTTRKYNVSFSFNRVCFKRAHDAIKSATDSLFKDFIFPSDLASRENFSPSLLFTCNFNLDQGQESAVAAILSLNSAPPYLIEDSRALSGSSRLKSVVLESVLQIYGSRNPSCRILICAPANGTCDELMKRLKNKIPESHMFRAIAAFREKVNVPDDIIPSCRYKKDKDCFICPPINELQKFQVIFSTFVSSVQLRDKGIPSGHFSHIFLVDASWTIEPEALVPLASLANKNTAVVLMGNSGQCSSWVRSDIGRSKGLKMSYFERLRKRQLYNCHNPHFVTNV
ncbi:hypothetical protein ACFE04_027410 [Oxalis oulophora]